MTNFAVDSYKVCSHCGGAFPLEQFGGSGARCRSCWADYMRRYRTAKRSKVLNRFTGQVRRADSVAKILAIVNGMAIRFGGLNRLCETWANHLQAAEPGSRHALSSFSALAHALAIAESSRQLPDLGALSDLELEAEARSLIERMSAAATPLGMGHPM